MFSDKVMDINDIYVLIVFCEMLVSLLEFKFNFCKFGRYLNVFGLIFWMLFFDKFKLCKEF